MITASICGWCCHEGPASLISATTCRFHFELRKPPLFINAQGHAPVALMASALQLCQSSAA